VPFGRVVRGKEVLKRAYAGYAADGPAPQQHIMGEGST
jgi:hypothetical protein